MIKSLNSNKHWCNPPTPERKKKRTYKTKLLKMAKKKGEVRKEKKKEGQIQTIALREKQC